VVNKLLKNYLKKVGTVQVAHHNVNLLAIVDLVAASAAIAALADALNAAPTTST